MGTLATDYRPKRFAELVGQGHIKPILKVLVRTNRVPPALIFSGTRGTGKTTAGRILAAALNCEESDDGDSCAGCVSCLHIQQGSSLSVTEIDAASNGGVGEIRSLREQMMYSHPGQWRVILLDEAHSLTREAFNALLKTLEEPPDQSVFVLLTTEPDRIIETVRSRAMAFDFRRLSVSDIEGRLKEIAVDRDIAATPELLTEIAERSQGGMRDAIMRLEQAALVNCSDIHAFRELFGIRNTAYEVLKAAADGDYQGGMRLIEKHFYEVGDAQGMVSDLTRYVADLLALKSGGSLTSQETELAERRELSAKFGTAQLVSVMRILWELRLRTRHVEDDQRATMEMAFVLIVEALGKRPEVPMLQTGSVPSTSRLSLAQMQEMAR